MKTSTHRTPPRLAEVLLRFFAGLAAGLGDAEDYVRLGQPARILKLMDYQWINGSQCSILEQTALCSMDPNVQFHFVSTFRGFAGS